MWSINYTRLEAEINTRGEQFAVRTADFLFGRSHYIAFIALAYTWYKY